MADGFDLKRFVAAQQPIYDTALQELKAARKQTHWMWFIFPQLRELGRSPTAKFYGIGSPEEARAFLRHPLLGARLVECARAVLDARGRSVSQIFGSPDDLKFCSSMTLFEAVAPDDAKSLFSNALDRLCDGKRDRKTLALIPLEG